MNNKGKRLVALLCASTMFISSCLVDGIMTAKASETENNDVIRYVNPAIPANVGETIDLTKYDVELVQESATESEKLTWYGEKSMKTIVFRSPSIGINVGETIDLTAYKVEFEKGVASVVDTWKNGDSKITTFKADAKGVYKLTAISGETRKNIYVVAKNAEETDYVLYRNDFNSADDIKDLKQVTNNVNTVTYSVSNGSLVISRSGSKWQESHLLLPEWLGEFGDYHVEIKTNITNQASNTSYVGIDMRMQNDSYPYYCAMMRYNKTYALNYRDANNAWASDSATYNNPNKAAAIDNVSSAFVFEAEMKGDTFSLKVNGNETLSTTNKKLYDTGRIALFANSVVPNIDYVEVTMLESTTESVTEAASITTYTPNKVGVTELLVKDTEGNEKTIYVVAKNPEDSEWVLYENDFNSSLDGIELVEGTPTSAVIDTENGKFNLDIKWRGNYRFPEWLGDFGNYRIEMTETCTSYASSNNKISLFARGQENNKYTPNYSVKLRYKGWDWDSVLLTKRLAWTDSATNWQWEDIAWGKYNSMEVNKSYSHVLNVQDDLIEYIINDETILYDVRERDLKTGHVGFAFDGNGNSDKISIDSVRVVFNPDVNAPEAPTAATYTRTSKIAGMADGKVKVTLGTSGSAAKDVVCYWGNGTGKLAGYTNFAKTLVKKGATTVTVDLGENIMIPNGATELRVYTENIAGESENCVCIPLPEGVSALETGNEVISFQVISDTHIKEDNTHYNSTHLETFLNSVVTNDPNSVGIFVGGDLVDNGTEKEYQNFQDIWNSVEGLPEMHAVIGNHEFWNGDWDATMEMFYEYTGTSEPYYHKEIDGYNFIFLASTEEEAASPTNAILGSQQIDWLKDILEECAESNKPIFVFLHQPLSNTVVGSTDKDVKETEEVKAILAEYPQALLFTSHSHMNLDTPGTMIAADENICNLFNTGAVSYLMNTHYTTRSFMSEEAQGYYVEVYEDKVLVRGKNLLTDEWLPSSQFVVFFDNEYGFEIEIGGSSVGYLDEAFDVYQYNKPTTKDNTYSVVGPVKPSQKDPNSNSGKGGASYFTTQYYGENSRYGLKPTYVPGGNSKGGYTVLTYTEMDVTDFEAEYEFYGSWGNVFGLAFGGQPGVFPVSLDNDNTNDIGVALYMESNGKLFVYGAIDTENITKSSNSITVATGSNYGNIVPGTANMNATGMTGSDSIVVDTNITENSGTFTVCVKVVNGILTVYEKNHQNLSVSVPLTKNYKGGYVSLIANATNHGAFKSFHINKIKTWDYDMSVEIGGSSVSYLDEAWDVYKFNKPSTASDTTSVKGPVEPSATDPDSYNGNYSYFTTKAYGNYSKGGLKPTHVPSNGYTLLTYTKDSMKDFEAEYDYYTSWSSFGLAFGGKLGTFPLSLDSDNSNDTGVAIYMSDNGTLYVYGAIDTSNVIATSGVKVDKNITGAATMLNTANIRATGMTNGESIAVDANGGTISKISNFFTVCVKVENGILTIHEKEHPGTSIRIALADTYIGGHVSLMSNQTQHGAFAGFRVSKLSENYNVSSLGLAGLNKYFDSYYFEEGADVAKGTVSSQWFLDPSKAPETYEGYYHNWALKPMHRNSGTKTSVLTLKADEVTNFNASIEYITAHVGYGIMVAPEGELPETGKGLKVSVTSEGRILVDGAIDVDTASWSGTGNAAQTGVYGIKGPALTGYIAPVSAWANSTANKTSYILNVKVENGVLTASLDGFEGELSVNLTANYCGGNVSLYSTGFDQGGFKNFALKELKDTKRIKEAELPLEIISNGEYAALSISTDVGYSVLSSAVSYDTDKFEYIGAIFNEQQDIINLDTRFVPEEDTIQIKVFANEPGEVVQLQFKKKVDTLDYSGFKTENSRIIACGGTDVAKVIGELDVRYDYTENKIIDVKDLVRSKQNASMNPYAVRNVLVGYADEEVSPLMGKSALYLGDSIVYGAADSLHLSWCGRIARRGMTYENVAVSGWAVTNKATSGRGQIVTQLDKASQKDYDFVILEGGVNDVLMMQSGNGNITWGEVTANGTNYDDSTIAGAIEDLIVKTKKKFPNAIVGYVINNYFSATEENATRFANIVKAACNKHGVAYLDLNEDERTGSKVFYNGCQYLPDNLHPNTAGYDIIAPVIADWMEGLVSGQGNN